MKNKISIIFGSAIVACVPAYVPAYAMDGNANIIIHAGYHTQQGSVRDAQTSIVHRHVSLGESYYFPNTYAAAASYAEPVNYLDSTKPLAVAAQQRLGKGVSAAGTVEFYYRVHSLHGASPVRKKTLSEPNAAWVESLNIPTYEALWGGDVIDVVEMQDALAVEFWFKHTTSEGVVRWDSNEGRNYLVPVASQNSAVLTVFENGQAEVKKPAHQTAGPQNLRIRYNRQIEGCSMIGRVYFDDRVTDVETFSVRAFRNSGETLSIEGIVFVPDNARTAHVYFEPAPYQYGCQVKRDPAPGETWSVFLR